MYLWTRISWGVLANQWSTLEAQQSGLPPHQTLAKLNAKAVTLSSFQGVLCVVFKGSTEALGIQCVGRDLGLSMASSKHTDSAAAMGYVGEQLLCGSHILL